MPERCNAPCQELTRLEHQVEELEAQNSSSHQGIYDRLRALEKSDAVQDVNYTTIIKKLDDLTAKVSSIESKPGKRWERIVENVIWAICAAVIAFLLARIGL